MKDFKTNYPSVSIVVLNFNGRKILSEELLSRCLSSVLNSDYPNFEVVFVDNGSTDESVKFIQQRFKNSSGLKIIINEKNYGFAVGNNMALSHTRGDYIFLINNDIEISQDCIGELIRVLEADHSVGIAQSKILSFDHIHIQTIGNLLDLFCRVYLIGDGQREEGQYGKMCEITFACGAALMTRRSLIEEIGLFDPDYFFYHDDSDFGWRARLAGYRIVSVPSSVVYHKGQGTSAHTFTRSQDYLMILKSRLGLFIKNLETKSIFKLAPKMSISMTMELVGLILLGDYGTPLRIISWWLRNLKSNWRKHIFLQTRVRKVGDDEVLQEFLGSNLIVLRLKSFFSRILGDTSKNIDESARILADNFYKQHHYDIKRG